MNPVSWLREQITPEQRRVISEEAKQSLRDKHWNEAFDAVSSYLVEKAKTVDPVKDREAALNVINCMQLLEAIKRELVRKIEDGEMAQVEIAHIEARNRPRVFSRM
jgi:hypothetical protein